MCLYMPIKKDRTLIGGLGLVNPLIEIVDLTCALVALCGYLNKLYDYIAISLPGKRCLSAWHRVGLRRVDIARLGCVTSAAGQEHTEANEC